MNVSVARRALPAGILAALALVGGALLFTRDVLAANQSVSISGFAFAPGTVTVNVGDTVTWTNNDAGVPHTASSDTPGVFDSGSMSTGTSFSHTFTAAGSFPYHCNIHPSMTGLVVVQGQAASPTATNTTAAATATATTAAATATPTAASTATAAPATATATTAAASPTRPASPSATTAAGTPSGGATSAPQPPATGNSGDDGSNSLLIGGGIVVFLLAAGGVAYGVMRRRA